MKLNECNNCGYFVCLNYSDVGSYHGILVTIKEGETHIQICPYSKEKCGLHCPHVKVYTSNNPNNGLMISTCGSSYKYIDKKELEDANI